MANLKYRTLIVQEKKNVNKNIVYTNIKLKLHNQNKLKDKK